MWTRNMLDNAGGVEAIYRQVAKEPARALDALRHQPRAIPDPVTDPLGAYLHAEFERLFAIEFPQGNSNAVRVRPNLSTHGTAGDRSPVARHLSLESAK